MVLSLSFRVPSTTCCSPSWNIRIGYSHGIKYSNFREVDSRSRMIAAVDVLVSRLRRKLEGKESRTTMIKTVRGAGYMFLPQVERRG